MKVFVVNCGSSSIKYQLFEMADESVLVAGLLERIGESSGRLIHHIYKSDSAPEPLIREGLSVDHAGGMALIAQLLYDPKKGILNDQTRLAAIGHRVVHGGQEFQQPALIDATVLAAIKRHIPLAPLHNPANFSGIQETLSLFPDVPQVAVFDTAFHQTLPPKAYRYALPEALYTEDGIRRYGFHGISHKYVATTAAHYLETPLAELNLITIHLGNGASMAAIEEGQSIETSMGMTPTEGLIMGTRSGDLDPAIPLLLARRLQMSNAEIDQLLNRQSGLMGICGSNDMRDILRQRAQGDPKAALAIAMYTHRIKKYIGAYYALLGHVDALIFTGGIGEKAAEIRQEVCAGLERMGICIDSEKNRAKRTSPRAIHQPESRLSILVVPTNEELEIARQSVEVVANH